MKLSSVLLVALFTVALADWVDFGIDGLVAELSVIESTPAGMILELTLPGVDVIHTFENGIDYSILNIPGTTPIAIDVGYPMLPTVSFLAAIPANGSVSMEVENAETVDMGYLTPCPMQPILEDGSYEPVPFAVVPSSYEEGTYPETQTACIHDGVLRGVSIGRFTITPFSWSAATGKITATRRIRVRIDYNGPVTINPRLNSRFWTPVFNQVLINSDILPEADRTVSIPSCEPIHATSRRLADDIDAADLLIMAGDDFADSMMDAFIDIKNDQGYLTVVVAAGSWSTTEIKDYIKTAYDTWVIPPSFVLFTGDSGDIPPYYTNGVYGDNRYCCVDGGDYIADIFHGRFVTGTDWYPTVEAKSLKWQFDPLMDADFWNNALCAGMLETGGGNTSTRWFLFTCETVRDTYVNIYGKTVEREYVTDASGPPPYYYYGFLPSAGQVVPADITFDGSTSGIQNSINSGVFLVQHRNHGSVNGWSHPSFTISDLAGLTNGDETPVVFSFNCSTGQFTDNCFAENFVCMEGGAVAVIAASGGSYSYFNDYLVYGMYFSFNDQYTSPPFSYTNPSGGYLGGQSLMAGKMEMQAAAPYGQNSNWEFYTEKEWDLFHFFGDPTMDLRTAVPMDLSVTAPLNLPAGATEATFAITDPIDGPVDQALVCLQKSDADTIWVSGLTDATGVITLTFDAITTATTMPWMVTAHNALPEEGAINGVGIDENTTTGITRLGRPFPNPSSSTVAFPVSLETAGNVSLTIFDLSGRAVEIVHDGAIEAGIHQLVWSGRAGDNAAPQGIYIARLVSPTGGVSVYKIVLAR